jgi:NagD protein
VLAFVTDATRERLADAGVTLVDGEVGERADVVLVAHPAEIGFAALERAARAVRRGAPLLTASYVPAYSGADGPIFSRGAMVTAAIAKVGVTRPRVVGKPSRAAMREIEARLGVPARELAVIGDDASLDIALGRLGGSLTVLVRTGISADVDPDRLPPRHRPDLVVDSIAAVRL